MREIICINCGKNRLAKAWNAKYCSSYCKLKNWRKNNPEHNREIYMKWRRKNGVAKFGSKEHRENVSRASKGRKWSEEHKRKMSEHMKDNPIKYWLGKKRPEFSGINNPNWKGGIVSKERLERNKFKVKMQKLIFERDNYTCQLCGQRGGDLQVDHIQSWAEYVELRFSMDNCRTLCMDCHYLITYGRPKPKNIVWGFNQAFRNSQLP